jgi:hypothetical protein
VDLKNMKVSIGMAVAIVLQAFGIIWYVATLDSTVASLDGAVAQIQQEATTVDVAVLQADLENMREKLQIIDEMHSEKFDPTDLEEDIEELGDRISDLEITAALLVNEQRQIMADHAKIGDALAELGKDTLTEGREYGNYGY